MPGRSLQDTEDQCVHACDQTPADTPGLTSNLNLSFVPRLVCPSGFMLSPLGSEVMISCHVAFFRVICYNPALQIKMTTTAPPGHVHEDFSTVIDEVKPAPVDKRKLSTTPLYRQEPPRLLARVALFTHSHPLQI